MSLTYTPDVFNQALIILKNQVLEMFRKDFKYTLGDRLSSEMPREIS